MDVRAMLPEPLHSYTALRFIELYESMCKDGEMMTENRLIAFLAYLEGHALLTQTDLDRVAEYIARVHPEFLQVLCVGMHRIKQRVRSTSSSFVTD